MDNEETFIRNIIREYPNLDYLMGKVLYDCYKAGTLDKILEQRKELGEFVKPEPENTVIKCVTIE